MFFPLTNFIILIKLMLPMAMVTMIIDDDDHETHHQVVQKDFELTDVIRGK